MPTNSVDVAVNLRDRYSRRAEQIARAQLGLNNSFLGGANNLKNISKQADIAQVKLKGLSASATEMYSAFLAFGKLQNVMSSVVGGAYNYSKMMESNAVGISGILQSMITVNDKTLSWNQSMRMSQDIMSKLRVEALQTAATSEDLIETFRGILGPGLSQGMSIDQVLEFTKVGVNAVRSLGLPSNQYLQELRSILQGNIRPSSSTLATALGITNADIKKAKKEAGGVYDFLLKRMEGFANATDATQKTVEGRLAILKEGLYAGLTEGGEELYNKFSGWLGDISKLILNTNDKTKKISLNPKFVEGVRDVAGNFETLGDIANVVFKGLAKNTKNITDSLVMFAVVKGSFAAFNSIVNAATGFTDKIAKAISYISNARLNKKLEELAKMYDSVIKITEEIEYAARAEKEMGDYLKNVSGGAYKLAEYYHSMGVEAERAAQMQRAVLMGISSGMSPENIERMKAFFDAEAKAVNERKKALALHNQELDVYTRIAEIQERANKSMGDLLNRRQADLDAANKRIAKREERLVDLENTKKKELTDLTERQAKAEAKVTEQIAKQEEHLAKRRADLTAKYIADGNKAYMTAMQDARKDSGNIYAGGSRTINSVERFGERLKALGAEETFITQKINAVNEAILNTKGKTLRTTVDLVNTLMRQAEEEAKATSAVKQQEESRKKLESNVKQVWAGLEKATNEIIRQRVEEEKLAEQARMVRDLQMLPGHYNYNGKEFLWNKDNVRNLNELKKTAEGYGLSQERINGILREYIRLVTEVGAKDAKRYVKATEAALQSAKAKENELRQQQKTAESVDNFKVKLRTLAEAQGEITLAQGKLYIDASNNISLLAKKNAEAAEIITSAWSLIGQKITDAGLKAKAEAEFLKVIASGNMALAQKMAGGINGAVNPNGPGLSNYLQNELLKESTELEAKRNSLLEMRKKHQQEIAELEAKGIKRTKEETEKLEQAKKRLVEIEREYALQVENLQITTAQSIRAEMEKVAQLQQGNAVQKKDLQEILALQERQLKVDQLGVLAYEAMRVARTTGDQEAVKGVEKLTLAIEKEAEALKKNGKSSSEYYELLIKLLRGVTDGTIKLTEAKGKEILAHLDNAEALKKEVAALGESKSAMAIAGKSLVGLASAAGSAGFAYQMLTHDTESNIGKLAEWAIQGSFVISAGESMISAVSRLKDAYVLLKGAIESAKLAQAGFFGLAAMAVVTATAVVAETVNKKRAYDKNGYKEFSYDEDSDHIVWNRLDEQRAQEEADRKKMLESLQKAQEMQDKMGNEAVQAALKEKGKEGNKVNLRYPGEDGPDKAAKAAAKEAERLAKEAEKAEQSYQELLNTVKVASDGLGTGITEDEKAMDKLNQQLAKWQHKISRLEDAGKDKSLIKKDDKDLMENRLRIYTELAKAEAERNAKARQYSNALQDIQNKETMHLITTREANALRVKTLEAQRREIQERITLYSGASDKARELQQKIREATTADEKKRLEEEYQYYKANADKKLQAEKELAENVKATREAMTTNGKIQWDEVLNHIKNVTFDQTATVKSGIDTIIGEFTNLGQNMLDSTKSVTEQLRDLCKNLANDILNMMMKIYMQGIMMNLIGNIFGGGGKTSTTKISGVGEKFLSNNVGILSGGGLKSPWKAASGGLHSGWGIVGEKGPELVNFSNPGRVYTADQTRNALSGTGNGNINIKLDIKNETGTQIEAQQTGSSFDGENYVLGIVLKAFATNKGGIRNIIKGVAAT